MPGTLLATPPTLPETFEETAGAPRRFRPGHYLAQPGPHWSPERQKAAFRIIDSIADDPYVTGIAVTLNWAYLESRPGNHVNGFAIVDAYLDKLGSTRTPKNLMLRVADSSSGHP